MKVAVAGATRMGPTDTPVPEAATTVPEAFDATEYEAGVADVSVSPQVKV